MTPFIDKWYDDAIKSCDSMEDGLAILSDPKLLSIFTHGARAALDRCIARGERWGSMSVTAVRVEKRGEDWVVLVRHESQAL